MEEKEEKSVSKSTKSNTKNDNKKNKENASKDNNMNVKEKIKKDNNSNHLDNKKGNILQSIKEIRTKKKELKNKTESEGKIETKKNNYDSKPKEKNKNKTKLERPNKGKESKICNENKKHITSKKEIESTSNKENKNNDKHVDNPDEKNNNKNDNKQDLSFEKEDKNIEKNEEANKTEEKKESQKIENFIKSNNVETKTNEIKKLEGNTYEEIKLEKTEQINSNNIYKEKLNNNMIKEEKNDTEIKNDDNNKSINSKIYTKKIVRKIINPKIIYLRKNIKIKNSDNQIPNETEKNDNKMESKLRKEMPESLQNFKLINEFINKNPNESFNIINLVEFLKAKLKISNDEESKICTESLNIFINMIENKKITDDILKSVIIENLELVSDLKIENIFTTLIKKSFNIFGTSNILECIIREIIKKDINLLIKYANIFIDIIKEEKIIDLPCETIIIFCGTLGKNTDKVNRVLSKNLLNNLKNKLIEEEVNKEEKEKLLKSINDELSKIQNKDEAEIILKNKIEKLSNEKSKKGGESSPEDISKKLKANKIIKQLQLKEKWEEKKKAVNTLEKILVNSNMNIMPNGLDELMGHIKIILSVSRDENFVVMIISILTKLIISLKSGFKKWASGLRETLIKKLSSNNAKIKEECQKCFDKWVELYEFESLINKFSVYLKNNNKNMRIEILNFFQKHKSKFTQINKEDTFNNMIEPLLLCLEDNDKNIKNLSEEIIKIILSYINSDNYYKTLLKVDLPETIKKSIRKKLDEIKKEIKPKSAQKFITKIKSKNLIILTERKKGRNYNNIINSSNSLTKQQTYSIQKNKTPSNLLEEKENTFRNRRTNKVLLGKFNTVQSFQKNTQIINTPKSEKKRKENIIKKMKSSKKNSILQNSVKENIHNKTVSRNMKFGNDKNIIKNYSSFDQNKNDIYYNLNGFKNINKNDIINFTEKSNVSIVENFVKDFYSDNITEQENAFEILKDKLKNNINNHIILEKIYLILKIIEKEIPNKKLLSSYLDFFDVLYGFFYNNGYKLNEKESYLIIKILLKLLSLNDNKIKEQILILLNKLIKYIKTNKIIEILFQFGEEKTTEIKKDILELTINLINEEKFIDISNKNFVKLLFIYLSTNEKEIQTKILILFKHIYSIKGEELWKYVESEKDEEFLKENLKYDEVKENPEDKMKIKKEKNNCDKLNEDETQIINGGKIIDENVNKI